MGTYICKRKVFYLWKPRSFKFFLSVSQKSRKRKERNGVFFYFIGEFFDAKFSFYWREYKIKNIYFISIKIKTVSAFGRITLGVLFYGFRTFILLVYAHPNIFKHLQVKYWRNSWNVCMYLPFFLLPTFRTMLPYKN